MKCNSLHEIGGMRCVRQKGHYGYCRCKSEPRAGGSIMYAEWRFNEEGKFRHVGYQSIYPKNAKRDGGIDLLGDIK